MNKKTLNKIAITILILLSGYGLIGFFLVPKIIEQKLVEVISEQLHSKASISEISFNPFKFELKISKFEINRNNRSTFKFNSLLINLEILPLLRNEINLSTFNLKEAELLFEVYKNQKTNWEFDSKQEKKNDSNNTKWTLNINQFVLDKNKITFNDFNYSDPVHFPIGPFTLDAVDFSTQINSESKLNDLNINLGQNGQLHLNGKLSLQPILLELNYQAKNLPLQLISSFLSNSTYIKIQDGKLSSAGILKYQNAHFNLDTNILIKNLKLNDQKTEFLSLDSLGIKTLKFNSMENNYNIGPVEVNALKTNIKLYQNGTINFKKLIRNKSEVPSTPPSKATQNAIQYQLENISFKDTELDFSDEQIKPNFRAHIRKISGDMGPLSSNLLNKIKIKLNGIIEEQGRFKSNGYFIQNQTPSELNLDVEFKNIEMTTFTPYSGYFAGYEIKKGKLFLDFNYQIKHNQIIGNNNIRLDNFYLGNNVESEHSTNLPLKLAVALLRDRNNQIKFKLPVKGETNNPSFSYGSFIRTALFNMIVNIAMSPFDFIKDTIGTGPEIQNIKFDKLSEKINTAETVKIDKLVTVLNERPQLKIDLLGTISNNEFEDQHNQEQRNKILPFDKMKEIALLRAQNIQNLLATKGVNPERIFVLAGKLNDDLKGPPGVTIIFKAE